ncbi:hypothetical protein ARHIZOSPH14_19470 [Agromyces rhizosphaerae]|uniref:Uncharacterized protein n=1 Tax=Agromyces rhizosphaerae TaxID=88374 RepID=A0A9W6FPQ4_9MICO|nr:hypothetical protein ARHIZOSPH14_19470 [Agromyces rhizosphaerae]
MPQASRLLKTARPFLKSARLAAGERMPPASRLLKTARRFQKSARPAAGERMPPAARLLNTARPFLKSARRRAARAHGHPLARQGSPRRPPHTSAIVGTS